MPEVNLSQLLIAVVQWNESPALEFCASDSKGALKAFLDHISNGKASHNAYEEEAGNFICTLGCYSSYFTREMYNDASVKNKSFFWLKSAMVTYCKLRTLFWVI